MTAERFKNMRWVIIGLCFLANAINFIDRANLAIAAPHIRAELALDPTTMGVIMSAFFWTYALCQMPAGWFIDKVGVRFCCCLVVYLYRSNRDGSYFWSYGWVAIIAWCW